MAVPEGYALASKVSKLRINKNKETLTNERTIMRSLENPRFNTLVSALTLDHSSVAFGTEIVGGMRAQWTTEVWDLLQARRCDRSGCAARFKGT
jgi:hypothetical protein